MYVCLCKGVTDSQIRELIDQGAKSYRDVRKATGVGRQCGQCSCFAKEVTHQVLEEQPNNAQLSWYSAVG